jgi:hypothetical protein
VVEKTLLWNETLVQKETNQILPVTVPASIRAAGKTAFCIYKSAEGARNRGDSLFVPEVINIRIPHIARKSSPLPVTIVLSRKKIL